MAEIMITHNPFDVKTEFVIDNNRVVETSGLYKYINTPMQDWVADFLPVLVEDCNDDELQIMFKGLQHNYDDLDREVRAFLAKNRDIEITLEFECCKSQEARLEELESLVEEMRTQNVVGELHDPAFLENLSAVSSENLRIVIAGGTNDHRSTLVDELLGCHIPRQNKIDGFCYVDSDSGLLAPMGEVDGFYQFEGDIPFIDGAFCQVEIYELPDLNSCDNKYYKFAAEAIDAKDNPIIICILEEDIRVGKGNSSKFLERIAGQYKIKGKRNKWRFIFVAESPELAKRMLRSEFAIKSAEIYALDDIVLIQQRIKEYQDEVCMVGQVKKQSDYLESKLNPLLEEMTLKAEQSKQSVDIDQMERTVIELLDKSSLIVSEPYHEQAVRGIVIDDFLHRTTCDFASKCFGLADESNQVLKEHANGKNSYLNISATIFRVYGQLLRVNTSDEVRPHIKMFIDELPKRIIRFLQEEGQTEDFELSINYDSTLLPLLTQVKCESVIDALMDLNPSDMRKVFDKNLNLPDIDELLRDIERIPVKAFFGLESREYPFYAGMKDVLCGKVSGGIVDNNRVADCIKRFEEELFRIRPAMYSYYGKCKVAYAYAKKTCESDFQNRILEIKKRFEEYMQLMRENAEISDEEKRRLAYVYELKARVAVATCL